MQYELKIDIDNRRSYNFDECINTYGAYQSVIDEREIMIVSATECFIIRPFSPSPNGSKFVDLKNLTDVVAAAWRKQRFYPLPAGTSITFTIKV